MANPTQLNQFNQSGFSNSWLNRAANRRSDNTLATANFLGTLRPGSLPVRFRSRGTLNRKDRVDVFRIDIAPGASISTQLSTVRVRGGSIRVEGYVALPGQAPTLQTSAVSAPGTSEQRFNNPFTNTFGGTIQVYAVIRSLNRRRRISYESVDLFS